MKIDLKSALGGLCLGALLALGIGAAVGPASAPYSCGRFQVAGSGVHFMILDTVTGQGWLGDFHNTLNLPSANDPFLQPKIGPSEPVH